MEEVKVNEQVFQCIRCGNIHFVNIDKIEDLGDEIYYGIYCSDCKEKTKHLWVGVDKSEVTMYYDVTLDKRYY